MKIPQKVLKELTTCILDFKFQQTKSKRRTYLYKFVSKIVIFLLIIVGTSEMVSYTKRSVDRTTPTTVTVITKINRHAL